VGGVEGAYGDVDAWDGQAMPTIVEMPGALRMTQMSCSGEHSVFLADDGKVFAAGNAQHGQLGFSKRNNTDPTVKQVPLGGVKMIEVACGATHTLTLAENGQVYVFGDYSSSNDHQEPTPLLGNTYIGEGTGSGDAYTMVKKGHGKLHTLSDERYDGAWDRNMMNGYGVYSFPNGDVYKGNWKDCMPDGVMEWSSTAGETYVGTFQGWLKHGSGKWTSTTGDLYEGEFYEDMWQGQGRYTNANGDNYNGSWLKDVMHGTGVFQWANGERYEGEYREDKKEGTGVYTWPSGATYEGQYKENKRHGTGKYLFASGERGGDSYSGEWRSNNMEGKGTYYYKNTDTYIGAFEESKQHGPGELTLSSGECYIVRYDRGNEVSRTLKERSSPRSSSPRGTPKSKVK